MYLTQTDLIKLKIDINAPMSDGQILKNIIDEDRSSTEKQDMTDGVNYYIAENDITTRKIYYYVDTNRVEDDSASNNKLVHAFHKILIDQKVSYTVGNPIIFSHDNDGYFDIFDKYRKPEYFNDIVNQWVKGSGNKGKEWIHFFVEENGELNYIINDAREIIPVYESRYQRKLIAVIRYYTYELINPDGKKEDRTKAEWWTGKTVTYFDQDDKGNYIIDVTIEPNPKSHWLAQNTATQTTENESWGRPPFVCLLNNDEGVNDLRFYKSLVDDYDLNCSDFSNNLADIQEAVWKLSGYEGESLKEFRYNLKKYKALKLTGEGKAETEKIDIPKDARDSHLSRLEDNIFMFGQGVNPNTDKFGNSPTGIALKRMYALLDLKSALVIRKLKSALGEYSWFINRWMDVKGEKTINVDEIQFVFNESMIVNEAEKIESLTKSKGLISDETIIENHPFVDDKQQELDRLAEDAEKMAQFINLDEEPVE